MFDRVRDLPSSVAGNADGNADAADLFGEVLEAGETPQYVLASDSIEHETDGRTTTIEPAGDNAAYLLATDERVYVVFGDQSSEPEVSFEMDAITKCVFRSGLLNSTLEVGHSEESVACSPAEGDAEALTDYVDRVAACYRSVQESLEMAMDTLETLESRINEGGNKEDFRLRVQSQLSEARHRATHKDDIPSEKLSALVDDAAESFQRRYVAAWLDYGESIVEDAEAELDDGEYAAFCALYADAIEAMATLKDAIDDFEYVTDEERERIETLAGRVAEVGEEYATAARELREEAAATEDVETAAERSLETYRRYEAAREAGWHEIDGSPDLATDETLETIATETVDALLAHADALEETGEAREDDDAEAAREAYERAKSRVQRAGDVAHGRPAIADGGLDERIEALEEKIDRTKWEWGGD